MYDKIKNHKEWKLNQEKLSKEFKIEIKELMDKYYYNKELEQENIILTLSSFAEEQYDGYFQMRDYSSIN